MFGIFVSNLYSAQWTPGGDSCVCRKTSGLIQTPDEFRALVSSFRSYRIKYLGLFYKSSSVRSSLAEDSVNHKSSANECVASSVTPGLTTQRVSSSSMFKCHTVRDGSY